MTKQTKSRRIRYRPARLQNSGRLALPDKAGNGKKYGSLRNLWESRPKITDEKQRKAGAHVLAFFAVMLILTIVARGMAGAASAQVEIVTAHPDEIVQEITGSAAILPAENRKIAIPEGVVIQEQPAHAGQTVQAGDALLQADTDALQEMIGGLQEEIRLK